MLLVSGQNGALSPVESETLAGNDGGTELLVPHGSALAPAGVDIQSAPAGMLSLRLLGTPDIMLGDVHLTFAYRKALGLLAYLAITGHRQAREKLATLFVGEGADDKAGARFRTILNVLHCQIGDYLLVTRQTVAFNRALPYWLDVEAMQTILTDPSIDEATLEHAVGLYDGELLTGLTLRHMPEFEQWLLEERARMRSVLARALYRVLEHAAQRGDDAKAIDHARRLIALEPWHEETHRRLMELLARSGHRREALAQYEICRRILARELRTEPQAATTMLYERLRATSTPPPHNLRLVPSAFVGRAWELGGLLLQLGDPACRLITIVGLGGSGKTSLALQAAMRYVRAPQALDAPSFADGVYLVDLSEVSAWVARGGGGATALTHRIAAAIASGLGLRTEPSNDPAEELVAYLRPRALLLVLDNFEHLLAGAPILQQILQQTSQVKLLVTSRVRLGLQDEWVLELGGLALPTGAEDLRRSEAGRLLLQQKQRARNGESLGEDAQVHMVRICQMAYGLPLALVLAAEGLARMSCKALAEELERGIGVLATTDSALPERQRSMRTVLAATWALLPAEQQQVLRQLTVFQRSFTWEAAHMVVGATLATLTGLAQHSLLSFNDQGQYTIHQLVRQYAATQLAAHADEPERVRAQHAAYYAAFVQRHASTLRQLPAARHAIGAEIDNVLAAWEWAVLHRDVDRIEQLRAGLAIWYELSGLFQEAAAVYEQAVAQLHTVPGSTDHALLRIRGHLLVDEARALLALGRDDQARSLLDEARELAYMAHALDLDAACVCVQAQLLHRQGKAHGAQQQMLQALALARTGRAPALEADCLYHLSRLALDLGEYPQAHSYGERGLALCRTLNDRRGEALALLRLGRTACEQGNGALAKAYLEDSLRSIRMFGDRSGECEILYALGVLSRDLFGCYTEADAYLIQARCIAQELGDRQAEGRIRAGQGKNALRQGDFPQAHAALEEALAIADRAGDLLGVGPPAQGLGYLAHYLGDNERARDWAQRALEIAQLTEQRRQQRCALRLLGHALVGLGQSAPAAVAYQQALDLDQTFGYPHLVFETMADLARVALAQGDQDRAVSYVVTILDGLQDYSMAGVEEPIQIYLTCYHILKARRDPRAEALLAAGHTLLTDRATKCTPACRHTFLASLPAHRALRQLWDQSRAGHGGDG